MRGTVALSMVVSAGPESPSPVPEAGSDAGWKGEQQSPGRPVVGTELFFQVKGELEARGKPSQMGRCS